MKTIPLRTADEIRAAVDAGKTVYCDTAGYVVIKDGIQQYFIKYIGNNHCIGLAHRDGQTLNGSSFFMLQP
jgi:hypothetical protein